MISQKPNGGSSKREAVLFALLTFLFTSPATGTSSEDGPIVVPLQWVRPSEEVLADFDSPQVDFEDLGWIGKQPIEVGLKGLPPTDRILFYGFDNVVYGILAESEVHFEYTDGEEVKEKTVPVAVVKFERYVKRRSPDNPKIRGWVFDMAVGSVELNGEEVRLAVLPIEDAATYHVRGGRIIWDLNKDGIFENETESRECYRANNPFSILGSSLQVERISPSGDEIVLVPADVEVLPKIEITEGEPAPEFAVVDVHGDTLRLADFWGRHVLLDFWFTTCGPCIEDTPKLVDIYRAKQAHGLEIIGISDDNSREAVLSCVEKNGIEWPQVIEVENETKPTEIYHISGFPSYVWVGPDGVVINPELKGDLDDLYDAF